MNSKTITFLATLSLMATWSSCEAQITFPDPKPNTQNSHTHTQKKSVTVTSDGKITVKRTVTVINGVEKVVTETTDADGHTTREESGEAEMKKTSRPWIGLRVKEVPQILRDHLGLSSDEGLVVELVADDSPSNQAGILAGDLLLALDQKSISTSEGLAKHLLSRKVGETTKALIMRKGKRTPLDIELKENPVVKDGSAPRNLTDGFGKTSVKSVDVQVDGGEIGTAFESFLDNPKLSDEFKESVRGMQKMLREFEQKNRTQGSEPEGK